jgi:hypothetical protein
MIGGCRCQPARLVRRSVREPAGRGAATRSPCSGAPPPPAWSWSPGRRSPSAGSTPARPSPSTSPAPCAAPPTGQYATSKPTAHASSFYSQAWNPRIHATMATCRPHERAMARRSPARVRREAPYRPPDRSFPIPTIPGISAGGAVAIAHFERRRQWPGAAREALDGWAQFLRNPYHRLYDHKYRPHSGDGGSAGDGLG